MRPNLSLIKFHMIHIDHVSVVFLFFMTLGEHWLFLWLPILPDTKLPAKLCQIWNKFLRGQGRKEVPNLRHLSWTWNLNLWKLLTVRTHALHNKWRMILNFPSRDTLTKEERRINDNNKAKQPKELHRRNDRRSTWRRCSNTACHVFSSMKQPSYSLLLRQTFLKLLPIVDSALIRLVLEERQATSLSQEKIMPLAATATALQPAIKVPKKKKSFQNPVVHNFSFRCTVH